MNRESLAQAAGCAREGRISDSLRVLNAQLAKFGPTYEVLSNIAALHLQAGDYQNARKSCDQAIQIDPYSHIAYFNRFLTFFCDNSLVSARKQIHKALSCLYLIRGFEEDNIKYLNRAIFYCEQNARAYLVRARLNEGKNNKLVQNDYSAAIEYDPNLAQIYQQRALFHRRINKTLQFQQDLASYLQLKNNKSESITELANNGCSILDEPQLRQKLQEEIRQYHELRINNQDRKDTAKAVPQQGQTISRLHLNSLKSSVDRKDDDQLLLSDRDKYAQGSAQTITIKKEDIQFKKKSNQIDKNFRQIFQDESSGQLDAKIDKLEREIEKHGGQITSPRGQEEELDVSDPSNFLTQEIQKAINQITKLSTPDLTDVKSAKSAGSQGSFASKLSQPRELSIQQFLSHKNICIEVVSLEDLQNYNRKATAKVQLQYGSRNLQTSMKKFQWRQNFVFSVNPDETQIQVTVIQEGGIFRSDSEMGQGTINLLQSRNFKCIIGNGSKKVAILYFKLTLS